MRLSPELFLLRIDFIRFLGKYGASANQDRLRTRSGPTQDTLRIGSGSAQDQTQDRLRRRTGPALHRARTEPGPSQDRARIEPGSAQKYSLFGGRGCRRSAKRRDKRKRNLWEEKMPAGPACGGRIFPSCIFLSACRIHAPCEVLCVLHAPSRPWRPSYVNSFQQPSLYRCAKSHFIPALPPSFFPLAAEVVAAQRLPGREKVNIRPTRQLNFTPTTCRTDCKAISTTSCSCLHAVTG